MRDPCPHCGQELDGNYSVFILGIVAGVLLAILAACIFAPLPLL